MDYEAFLRLQFLDSSVQRWLTATAVMVAVGVFAWVVRNQARTRFRKWAKTSSTFWDDAVVETVTSIRLFTIWLAAALTGLSILSMPDGWKHVLHAVLTAVLIIQGAMCIQAGVRAALTGRKGADDPHQKTVTQAIRFVGNFAIWSVVLLLVLANFGVEVGALVAGLGIGGVAAALAVQNVLGDVFSALSLYIDRPFDIGDFIVVGDEAGNVEHVGWRSTRVKSIGGQQIVFANSDLADVRIHNFRRMAERRIVQQIGVVYGTETETLEKLPGLIREAVESVDEVRFDRAHFKGFGDWSLDLELVYYVLSPDFAFYMDKQQAISLAILRRFRDAGAEFAFPTRTLDVPALQAAERKVDRPVDPVDPGSFSG